MASGRSKTAQQAAAADDGITRPTTTDADPIPHPGPVPALPRGATPTPVPLCKASSNREAVLALLRRRKGAHMAEIVACTGWQPHSARAWLSGLRKQGHLIERSREEDGSSRYRLIPTPGGPSK